MYIFSRAHPELVEGYLRALEEILQPVLRQGLRRRQKAMAHAVGGQAGVYC